jgi:hypothetical protein
MLVNRVVRFKPSTGLVREQVVAAERFDGFTQLATSSWAA